VTGRPENPVPLRPATGGDQLEELARSPLQARRGLLRDLAARARELDALSASENRTADEQQLTFEDVA
jgi:hypothetical protein